MKKITKKLLLSLGFEKEKVSGLDSGDKPYKYFVFNLKNERALLITCTDDERINKSYTVEFFDFETFGKITDGKTLKTLCDILSNLK